MSYFNNIQLSQMFENAHAVIFDMNGLIVDDEKLQLEAVNMTLEPYKIGISEDTWIADFVGHKATDIFCMIMNINKVEETQHVISELKNTKNDFYKSLVQEKLFEIVRPGVLELADFSFGSNIQKMAVATSASFEEVEIILGGLGIKDKFDVIVCGDEVLNSKPDPEIYLTVSKKLNIKSKDCVVFEDTSIGVKSAIRAGMRCVAVPNKYTKRQDFSGADFVVDSLSSGAHVLI